jgi:peptide/nickel transport system substrate-binding protein
MTLSRRRLAQATALLALPGLGLDTLAQRAKDTLVLGMVLEPSPGLDPTTGAAAAIGEVVHYNVLEGLTKVTDSGAVLPLLATDWVSDPDGKTYTFKLRGGVKFQDGTPFNAEAVKFSFERAKAPDSTNKAKKTVFENISSIATPQPDVVILTLNNPDATLPFRLGEAPAVILSPKSAATTATQPVGTGPFKLDSWQKGSAITLVRWDGFRDLASIKLRRVTFRFINDNAAQVAALLAGDIDGMPRFGAVQAIAQLRAAGRFNVEIGSTAGKGILAINNKKKPLDDVRVRRAISHAIDRKAFIDGVLEGLAKPIGSHAAPTDLGYVDLTGLYPYDPEKAKALLKEAGITSPLNLTLTLPPPSYARKGGEVVAAMLAKVGITAKIENVEWAQWLSVTFTNKNYDLTIISHVEPFDLGNYAKPGYYWGYESPKFTELFDKIQNAPRAADRAKLLGDAQRMLANEAVHGFLYQPQWITVANKGLKGLWKDMPVFVNDVSALSWS